MIFWKHGLAALFMMLCIAVFGTTVLAVDLNPDGEAAEAAWTPPVATDCITVEMVFDGLDDIPDYFFIDWRATNLEDPVFLAHKQLTLDNAINIDRNTMTVTWMAPHYSRCGGSSITAVLSCNVDGYVYTTTADSPAWSIDDYYILSRSMSSMIVSSTLTITNHYADSHYTVAWYNADTGSELKTVTQVSFEEHVGVTDRDKNSFTIDGRTYVFDAEDTRNELYASLAEKDVVLKLYFRPTYTVTYDDGLSGVIVFPDESYEELKAGDDTPEFSMSLVVGEYEYTDGVNTWVFQGWEPQVAEKVNPNDADEKGEIVYRAQWMKKTGEENPDKPEIPEENPDKPEVPEENPDKPEVPEENPDKPEVPEENPDKPEVPEENPDKPEVPEENPDKQEQPPESLDVPKIEVTPETGNPPTKTEELPKTITELPEDVPDTDVPLVDVPQTGDLAVMWYITPFLLIGCIIGLTVFEHRKKH